MTDNYLDRSYRTNENGCIMYPEISAGFGATKLASATGDKVWQQKLIVCFAPVLEPQNKFLIPTTAHVDFTVFGVVPLDIFLLNDDTHFLALGLAKADALGKACSPMAPPMRRAGGWTMRGWSAACKYRHIVPQKIPDMPTTWPLN